MEDAILIETNLPQGVSCFGIFDGHFGCEVAQFVAKHFCEELVNNHKYKLGRYEAALSETYLRIDRQLLTTPAQKEMIRYIQKLPDDAAIISNFVDSVAGCSALVALIKDSTVYVSSVGNSHCILSKKGKAIELAASHLPENHKETERIHKAGGIIEKGMVMGNLNISRSLGDIEYKFNPDLPQEEQMVVALPDVRRETIDSDSEFLLLMTDSMRDAMTVQQLISFINLRRSARSAREIVEDLMNACTSRDTEEGCGLGCDNMTCILILFK